MSMFVQLLVDYTLTAWIVGVIGVVGTVIGVFWGRRERDVAIRTYHSANRLKNEFVSLVSHELRTPITAIHGFAETLRDTEVTPEETKEYLNIIIKESIHLATLVEDILVVPRLEAGRLDIKPEVIEISEILEALIPSVFLPGSDRVVQVNVPSGIRVFADPKRAGQIVRNLLTNARDHGGGTIAVEGTYIGTHYQLMVSDNGQGVPVERRAAIFREFEQASVGDARQSDGIGLGLPIARKLAQQMGGELWFEARFPVGSRFCVSFPLSSTHVGAMNRASVNSAVNTADLSWG